MPFIADGWLHVPNPRPFAQARLLCLHHAGGATTMFAPWARAIDPRIELCAFALPGRGGRIREAPAYGLRGITERLAAAWQEISDRPVAIFGHSFGVLLTYELLASFDGELPAALRHVFISSFSPPGTPVKPGAGDTDEQLIVRVLEYDPDFHTIASNPDLLALVLPAIRADFRLVDNWMPGPLKPLTTPLSVFGGERDPRVSPESLAGWSAYAGSSFSLRLFGGGHFYLRERGDELVKIIGAALREV
jgi:surfactin synthase thioesterase subunit